MPELVAGPGIALAEDAGANTLTVSAGGVPLAAVSNNSTNDGAAFAAAVAASKSAAGNVSINGFYKGGPPLQLPAAKTSYLSTTTLEVTHTFKLKGDGGGRPFGAGSGLRWAAGATGIRIQRYNTSGVSTVDGTPHFGGDGLTIEGVKLEGGFAGTEGEYHGIHAKGHFNTADVWIYKFQGDGIHADATLGGGATEGDVSMSNGRLTRIESCRRAAFVKGNDANVIDLEQFDFTANRQAGAWIDSGIGPVNLRGCHATANGVGSHVLVPTQCSNSGNRYAVKLAQEVGASTNAPSGTTADNTWWLYIEAGGADATNGIPAWVSGTTFRVGGAYIVANDVVQVTLTGCYAEDGQFSQFGGATLLINCAIAARYMRGGAVRHPVSGIDRIEGNGQVGGSLTVAGGNIQMIVGGILMPSGYGYFINGVQVVGQRGAAVADATNSTDVITQLNALLARIRAHGLIAP